MMGGSGKSDQKGIDIRKGISIEKNIKMKDDGSGKSVPKQEFDIIQHSQSNFDGVRGALIKQTKSDKKSKMAL